MSFEEQLRAFAKKTDRRANLVVKKIVIDVGTALVMKSPVGDPLYWKGPAPAGYVGGRFRANWQYQLDAPDTSTTMNTDKSGGRTIGTISAKVPTQAAGKMHYITNSLSYGPRLEDGFSRQAPNGMVRLTVNEFQPIVAAAARALS